MRRVQFSSFVSERSLALTLLLLHILLPTQLCIMVHSLEISPFPCYPNDTDCEASVPYHHEAHDQWFEVWLKQSDDDDADEKQSYIYVDEQPDGYVCLSHTLI